MTRGGIFVSSVVLLLGGTAAAERPTQLIRRSHDKIKTLLSQSDSKNGIRQEIKGIVNSFLDYQELSKRALGRHWESRTKQEQNEFVAVLRDLIERNYVRQLRDNLHYKVLYKQEEIATAEATVHTIVRVVKRRRKVDTFINYKLRKDEERWLVFDVITDDMSLVRTYRSQFNRIIQRESYESLLKKMKLKLAEG